MQARSTILVCYDFDEDKTCRHRRDGRPAGDGPPVRNTLPRAGLLRSARAAGRRGDVAVSRLMADFPIPPMSSPVIGPKIGRKGDVVSGPAISRRSPDRGGAFKDALSRARASRCIGSPLGTHDATTTRATAAT